MDECELIFLISTVACSLSKCCSTDDLTILSAVFTQLGDTLTTILTKRELSENKATSNIKTNDNNNIGNCKKDEND